MCHLKYIYEKRNFSDQPGSPDDRSADSLQLLLWTPKSNCAIQVLRFTPTLRHSGTEGKTTTRDTKISLGYGRKSLGPKLGPGPISFPRENSCPCDIGNLKVLKYDQRALQTQNASQRDIALKSTSVMMNRFTDLQISTAQHDDWPPLRARQKLGRSGGNVDGWSPKGVHVGVRRAPLLPLDPWSLSYVEVDCLSLRMCTRSERTGRPGKEEKRISRDTPFKAVCASTNEYHVRP
jgi:hypothetical protein